MEFLRDYILFLKEQKKMVFNTSLAYFIFGKLVNILFSELCSFTFYLHTFLMKNNIYSLTTKKKTPPSFFNLATNIEKD